MSFQCWATMVLARRLTGVDGRFDVDFSLVSRRPIQPASNADTGLVLKLRNPNYRYMTHAVHPWPVPPNLARPSTRMCSLKPLHANHCGEPGRCRWHFLHIWQARRESFAAVYALRLATFRFHNRRRVRVGFGRRVTFMSQTALACHPTGCWSCAVRGTSAPLLARIMPAGTWPCVLRSLFGCGGVGTCVDTVNRLSLSPWTRRAPSGCSRRIGNLYTLRATHVQSEWRSIESRSDRLSRQITSQAICDPMIFCEHATRLTARPHRPNPAAFSPPAL